MLLTLQIVFFLLAITPFLADKAAIIKENGESIVHLTGNVIIEDDDTKITCFEAMISETKGSVVLKRDVKIEDCNGEIKANAAVYYFDSKKGYLNGDVILLTDEDVISSDSLYYDGKNKYVEMFSNVKIENSNNNLIAYGQKGWYDLEKEQGHLIEGPRLEISREDREPLKISAQEFVLNAPSNMLYGYDSVIAIIDSIIIYCDTFAYNLETENGDMVKPVIQDNENELIGETGQFQLENSSIESFSVEKGSSRYTTEGDNVNIVKGSEITIFFREGTAFKILVQGQPEGSLYLKRTTEESNVSD